MYIRGSGGGRIIPIDRIFSTPTPHVIQITVIHARHPSQFLPALRRSAVARWKIDRRPLRQLRRLPALWSAILRGTTQGTLLARNAAARRSGGGVVRNFSCADAAGFCLTESSPRCCISAPDAGGRACAAVRHGHSQFSPRWLAGIFRLLLPGQFRVDSRQWTRHLPHHPARHLHHPTDNASAKRCRGF
jgi:hypothetical protein